MESEEVTLGCKRAELVPHLFISSLPSILMVCVSSKWGSVSYCVI
jgi:hypothetical protein